MTPLSDVIARLVWTQLWQATVVIVAVATVTRLFARQKPHLAYALWLIVLVKCLIPPIWSSPTGIFTWTMPRVISPSNLALTNATTHSSRLASPAVEAGQHMSSNSHSSEGAPTDAAVPTPHPTEMHAGAVLWLIWLFGAAGYACFALLAIANCWRKIRAGRVAVDPQLATLFDDLRRQLGIRRRVRLDVIRQPLGPLTFGLLRPSVVLPESLAAQSSDEVGPLLAHELVHVRRADSFFGVLQVAAQCVWWFHPLVWWANREIVRQRERCCDEEVVAGLAYEPGRYARALVNVLDFKQRLRWLPALPGVHSFEMTKKRLEDLVHRSDRFLPRTPMSYWFVLSAGVLIVVPGAALTAEQQSAPSEHSTPIADHAVKLPARTQESSHISLAARPDSDTEVDGQPSPLHREPYPQLIDAKPAKGETNVAPTLGEIRVTFDRDMEKGMSWTGGPPLFPPLDKKRKARWTDPRTCVLPVKLQPGHFYRLGINSQSFRNFRANDGVAAPPSVLYFTTKGASQEVNQRVRAPEIVAIHPANGAKDIDPTIRELSVTFNVPMGKGMSWTGNGPQFPKMPDDQKGTWSSDGRTCTLPVQLEPGHDYQLGLNSLSFNNFQSEWGVPLEPVVYRFSTRP